MTSVFPVTEFHELKEKVLNWVRSFNTFCFLDNHQYQVEPHTQECLLAAGIKRKFSISAGNADTFSSLQDFIDAGKQSWLFGHFGYDLKNELEDLSSNHPDHLGFPELFFFEPAILLRLNETQL